MKIFDFLTDYRFRIFNKWWWRDFWYNQVASRVNPRQKWLTKKIPRTWVDKDTILEIAVIESLKHYCDVNGEDCFNVLDCEVHEDNKFDDNKHQAEFMRQVKHHYELATVKLPALQKEEEEAWKKVPHFSVDDIINGKNTRVVDYEKTYGEVNRLEKEVEDLQTEIMVWVVKNRKALWT